MAIIDDNTTAQDSGTAIQELKNIDINDLSLPEGKEENINPDADAWARACPPPDGVFLLHLKEGRNCYQQGKLDDGSAYYVANLECKILEDEKWNGTIVFGKLSTYIPVGKEISTVAAVIKKFGVTIPVKATHKAIIQLLRKCLIKEPKLYVEGEWAAWDMPKGEWIKRGMKNFPSLGNGHYQHVVRDSKGQQVTAKWKPLKWYSLKEYRNILEQEKLRKQQQGSNQQAQQQDKQQHKTSEVVENFEAIKPNSSANAAVNNVVEDDFVIDE